MKATYVWLTRLIGLAVVLQAAFVAWGAFEIFHSAEHGQALTADSDPNAGQRLHTLFGLGIIPLLAVALLVVAYAIKIRGAVRLAAIVLALVALDVALGFASFPVPVLGTLHTLVAVAVAAVAGVAGRRAGTATPAPDPTPPTSAAPAMSPADRAA